MAAEQRQKDLPWELQPNIKSNMSRLFHSRQDTLGKNLKGEDTWAPPSTGGHLRTLCC